MGRGSPRRHLADAGIWLTIQPLPDDESMLGGKRVTNEAVGRASRAQAMVRVDF